MDSSFLSDFPLVDVAAQFVLRNVSDQNHSSSYDISIFCAWDDPEASVDEEDDERAFVPCARPDWTPHFHVDNSTEYSVIGHRFFRSGSKYFMFYNVVALVHQVLELVRFPFDRQIVEANVEPTNCRCRPWQFRKTNIPIVETISSDVEVVAESILETWIVDYVTAEIRPDMILLECGLERLPEFFVYNVSGFLFILSLAANASTAVPIDDIADRFSLSVTLMLAVIAFKFVIVTMIPPTAFITLLDKYILSSLGYIFLVMVKDIVWSTAELSQESDRWLTLGWAASWVVVHVILAVAAFRGWFLLDWDQVEEAQAEHITFGVESGKKVWHEDLDLENDDIDDEGAGKGDQQVFDGFAGL
eukprot:TRINITY_DN6202_c0_g1_i1.p1 TRINITY_DN6202_c0_g1~~TRINITY_DN6202_c0_g1_i1.p1  ORF type:complete len:380 (+),score=82.50 TRINITY_DN6202_c0_g1_i1:62-1141(+)